MLKRINCMLLLCLIFSITPMLASDKFSAGIKGGIGFSNLSGDNISNILYPSKDSDYNVYSAYESRTGLIIGGFLGYRMNRYFAIQPEVLIAMKGAKSTYGATSFQDMSGQITIIGGDWDLNYLELPLLAKIFIPLTKVFEPNVFAGPSINVKLSAKYADDVDINNLKSTDIGLILGGGADIGRFGVEARYGYGLADIYKDSNGSIKNKTFAVLVSYEIF